MIVIAEIQICGACLTLADGQPSIGTARTQADCAVAATGQAELWPPDPAHVIHSAGDGEGGFSWQGCEGCGNPDGQHLHPAVVLGPNLI